MLLEKGGLAGEGFSFAGEPLVDGAGGDAELFCDLAFGNASVVGLEKLLEEVFFLADGYVGIVAAKFFLELFGDFFSASLLQPCEGRQWFVHASVDFVAYSVYTDFSAHSQDHSLFSAFCDDVLDDDVFDVGEVVGVDSPDGPGGGFGFGAALFELVVFELAGGGEDELAALYVVVEALARLAGFDHDAAELFVFGEFAGFGAGGVVGPFWAPLHLVGFDGAGDEDGADFTEGFVLAQDCRAFAGVPFDVADGFVQAENLDVHLRHRFCPSVCGFRASLLRGCIGCRCRRACRRASWCRGVGGGWWACRPRIPIRRPGELRRR